MINLSNGNLISNQKSIWLHFSHLLKKKSVSCDQLWFDDLISFHKTLRQRQRTKAVILLVERTKMIVLHMQHAFLNISLPFSSKLLREMNKFKVLTITWTNFGESFSLTLYFKSVSTNLLFINFFQLSINQSNVKINWPIRLQLLSMLSNCCFLQFEGSNMMVHVYDWFECQWYLPCSSVFGCYVTNG